MYRSSGVLVPLFSVYAKNSLGIGDFTCLKLLVDWCALTGNSILQLLPMNEMGILSCPYDALSSFALEPVYLSLKTTKRNPSLTTYVNYGIKKVKRALLRDRFGREDISSSLEFRQFSKENDYWLGDFTLYKALKLYHQDKPWYDWQDEYKNRDSEAIENFKEAHQEEINFQAWLQWLAFKQLSEIKGYAEAKKVFLMGDLPLLVSRDSADVWSHPEYFKLEFAAGAPPDMYSALGQRWGMPTYRWENIASDDYRYLKEKLRYAQNFYHFLRVDHVVGLFRIWTIPYNEPLENKGRHGFFDPADEGEWEEHGKNLLLVMRNNTQMQLCAEDLGIIPAVCPKVLEELGIPGNDVQRWMRDWNGGQSFLRPTEYRQLSVAMLSTHDTSNWPAWWEGEVERIDKQRLWKDLGVKGPVREKSDAEMVREALKITLEANSILCINTIIDWLYLADIFKGKASIYRINTPGTIDRKNWSLRLPLSLEDLMRHKVNRTIRSLIEASGRI